MKTILVTSLLLISFSSMAYRHEKKEEWKKKWDAMSFEEAKKFKTDMLAQKKSMIEEAQGCVDKTTDKKGIESCMDKMKGEMKTKYQGMEKKMKK